MYINVCILHSTYLNLCETLTLFDVFLWFDVIVNTTFTSNQSVCCVCVCVHDKVWTSYRKRWSFRSEMIFFVLRSPIRMEKWQKCVMLLGNQFLPWNRQIEKHSHQKIQKFVENNVYIKVYIKKNSKYIDWHRRYGGREWG